MPKRSRISRGIVAWCLQVGHMSASSQDLSATRDAAYAPALYRVQPRFAFTPYSRAQHGNRVVPRPHDSCLEIVLHLVVQR